VISVIFGLGSALAWGAADFAGGMASRRTGIYRSVFFGESIGLLLLLAIAFRMGEPAPEARSLILAALAGSIGTFGLLLLYHALATGTMSIAAPVSALMSAALPVVIGGLTEGLPGPATLLGFLFALTAVWLVSQSSEGGQDVLSHVAQLRIPVLAGVGFGLFFVLMHAATRSSTVWPMAAARGAGLFVTTVFMLVRRDSWQVPRSAWPVITVNGILDVTANGLFVLAGQTGRLDIAAVLGSLYPGGTVVLAWVVLKERLARTQWIGILAAMIAILLFTF
jgi:drug/metabolite transporter (DMT)-like permease